MHRMDTGKVGMYSLTAYADADALTAALQQAFASNESLSRFPVAWGEWSTQIRIRPKRTSLGAQPRAASPHANVAVHLLVEVFEIPIPFVVTASLTMHDDRIVMRDPEVVVESTPGIGLTDQLAELVRQIAPVIAERVVELPLPQLHQLFASDIDATLSSLAVVELEGEYFVQAVARPRGHGAGSPAPLTLPASARREASALRAARAASDLPAPGRIVLMVSEGAFNLVMNEVLEDHVFPIDRKGRTFGLRVGIRSEAEVDRVRLSIPGETARASADLKFRNTSGGVKFGGLWSWQGMDIKRGSAALRVRLYAQPDGRAGYLLFSRVDDITARVGHRGVLGFAADALQEIVDEALDMLLPEINDWFRGQSIELFRLPATLPGTTIPTNLEFRPGGLRFARGMALLELEIKPPPGAPGDHEED